MLLLSAAAKFQECKMVDGLLLSQGYFFLPDYPELQQELLSNFHDTAAAGHQGHAQIVELIARHYYWLAMQFQVNRHLDSCKICLERQGHQKHVTLRPLHVPTCMVSSCLSSRNRSRYFRVVSHSILLKITLVIWSRVLQSYWLVTPGIRSLVRLYDSWFNHKTVVCRHKTLCVFIMRQEEEGIGWGLGLAKWKQANYARWEQLTRQEKNKLRVFMKQSNLLEASNTKLRKQLNKAKEYSRSREQCNEPMSGTRIMTCTSSTS